jgi:hypothetical protein
MLELTENPSARVAFESSRHVLAVGGISPVEHHHVTGSVEIRAGYVIDLRNSEPRGELVDVTPPAPELEPPAKTAASEVPSFRPDPRWSTSAVPMKPANRAKGE